MKKNLFILAALFVLCMFQPVLAKTVQVESLQSFSTADPPEEISVLFLDSIIFDDDFRLYEGLVVRGKLTNLKDPKRLKRNASFTFVPISYTDKHGCTYEIESHYKAKYATELDKGQLVKSAALGVGGYFVKGLSQGVSLIEGVVKNEEGNRIKSGVVNVYKTSPLAYIEKGEDIEIQAHEVFILNFKLKSDEEIAEEEYERNKPNYEYTLE